LAGKLLCLTAVRRGEDGFCGGMDARAIGFEVVKSAGSGETFERALIDLARIEFCREMTEIAKGRRGGLAMADISALPLIAASARACCSPTPLIAESA